MDESPSRKKILERDLYSALKQNELVLHYQPQINTKNNKMIGVEALLRWSHPKFGTIMPGEFISIAEETGLILPINEWVLRTACRQVKTWHRLGFLLKVGVNLSPSQFDQDDLVPMVADILKETDLEPYHLDLEITESVALNDMNVVIDKLKQFKQLGVKISVDDFGTGYSSLSYLTKFPIDTLKIAREFVDNIGQKKADEVVIRSIVTIAQNLSLSVIAEGVETKNQLLFLQSVNCYTMQGYLFGKPMSTETIDTLLKVRNEL
ncbi:EAL domain-containing protein [Paenibacillus sediminis]|uniref:EAL domain-containing protein (Putative c-di-GMP-specific phosphodiesterase class I) n=1 Tax=Paenibacillus sediminis TaxID=664909 RepID=A0ABS4H2Q0_9BACL|nr:EAL domain-containing protein [Paenibacillus sediminis]MBP1936788.1 EAL domain-containing protein (putative c-di-GMP-specific phosphodiesterase class I) [Paenibacillus sediminis]